MLTIRIRKPLFALTAAATAVAVGGIAVPGSAGAAGTRTAWVAKPLCAAAKAHHMACFAEKLVKIKVPSTGTGWTPSRVRRALAFGPAGGYSPAQLAKAYGLNSNATTSQTVAIVDAFNDPTVRADLNTFDSHYGLPNETATSLRVVNQNGNASPLPANDSGWAAEITLDVQAVRGLCHKCKILLVEATSSSFANLAAAVNRAVTMGAKIVSNSYGGPESGAALPAYNHPGVAILASTGDAGWYAWDQANNGATSDNVPSAPASYNTVIGVGGTSLYLNPTGSRASETVWNENGPGDVWGRNLGVAIGAAGSGCSRLYAPRQWQKNVAGYSTLGCGTSKRNGVDIAALADPFTGYDICQNYGNTNGSACGWETFGGTSLASPLVAAMWGLAGGPGGVSYPALSLYGHYKSDKTHPLYDVTVGGTGYCDTASPVACDGGANPNRMGAGLVDCAWGASGTAVLANRYQCYAKPGYDGVSGVGTPKGVAAFKPMSPAAAIARPSAVQHGVAHTFSAAGSTDPFPGGSIVSYAWNWGDGHSSTGASATHSYATQGTRTITLTVTDNYGRTDNTKLTISIN